MTLLHPGPTRPPGPRDATHRVVLVHHAGGSDVEYRRWARYFPPEWDVLAVGLPGRGGSRGAPVVRTIAELSDRLVAELSSLPDRPLALFGHSMGALVCYDLARTLIVHGLPAPLWLGVSAHPGPAHHVGGRPAPTALPSEELRALVSEWGGLEPRLLADDTLWSFVEPPLRQDLDLVASWSRDRLGAPLPVPLTAFCGSADRLARPAQAASWAEHTDHFLGLRVRTGGHFYFRGDVRTVIDQIVFEIRSAARHTTVRQSRRRPRSRSA